MPANRTIPCIGRSGYLTLKTMENCAPVYRTHLNFELLIKAAAANVSAINVTAIEN